MPTSSIEVPAGLGSGILGVASTTLNNFSTIIAIIVGMLLAMLAIEFLIGAFHHK